MGTYCTVKDVRLALTPEGDPTNSETGAKLPDYQIEDAISEAEGIIDAFIKSRYSIVVIEIEEVDPSDPLVTLVYLVAPSPLRGWARDVAAYLCALTYRKNKDLSEDDPIRLRYLMIQGFLTDVRDGKMNLPLPVVDPEDAAQGVHVENQPWAPLFTLNDVGLDGYNPNLHISGVYIPSHRTL